ncbi:Maf family protein [Bordetella petrii]|uniref:dTTP/UTP pyrophosphatase n=1 Tax=Bordetella petrii (strain ATCC BAA-461 / DSM 12804 / CCUG 43448 / CIP 107267 / Se-1111R) TaxID=340100 RepID=A9ITP0_BORPD|nr:Maf family protein [Bordetella petrii]CAP43447.1 Maf-like protein [Bordetella petrii]
MASSPDSDSGTPRLYLASASPRRRELLDQIGLAHTVLRVPAPPGEDEPQHEGETAADYVRRTARDKAERGRLWMAAQQLPVLPVLAADTTVVLQGQVLGKPADRADAARMLARLSGSLHQVHTAVALWHAGQLQEAVSVSEVRMRELTEADIARYCDSGEPYGKAGAYGIQGLAGTFIAHLAGSYSGVMGLPLYETAGLLRRVGILLP